MFTVRAILLVGFLIAGCSGLGNGVFPRPGTPEGAEALAGQWLNAVSGGAADRGWSMLHPLSRARLFADKSERYLDEVVGIDWGGFKWHIEPPTVLDGNFRVTVVIDGNRRPAGLLADGRLIQEYSSSDGIHRASIAVKAEWADVAGILGV